MTSLASEVARIVREVDSLLADPTKARQRAMPGESFFLDQGDVLCLPRDNGDSRYPYGQDGFNFWAYASGYMHGNEGLFSQFLRAAEGQEPKIAFFAGLPRRSGRFTPLPLLQVPVMPPVPDAEARRYTVLTPTAAYYVTECGGLRFVVRVFVTADRQICFSLYVENRSPKTQALVPLLVHQPVPAAPDLRERRGPLVQGDPRAETRPRAEPGSFLVRVNEDKDRHRSVTRYGVIRRGLMLGGARKRHAARRPPPATGTWAGRGAVCTRRRRWLPGRLANRGRSARSPRTRSRATWSISRCRAAARPGWISSSLPRRTPWARNPPPARGSRREAVDADHDLLRAQEAQRRQGLSVAAERAADKRLKPPVLQRVLRAPQEAGRVLFADQGVCPAFGELADRRARRFPGPGRPGVLAAGGGAAEDAGSARLHRARRALFPAVLPAERRGTGRPHGPAAVHRPGCVGHLVRCDVPAADRRPRFPRRGLRLSRDRG